MFNFRIIVNSYRSVLQLDSTTTDLYFFHSVKLTRLDETCPAHIKPGPLWVHCPHSLCHCAMLISDQAHYQPLTISPPKCNHKSSLMYVTEIEKSGKIKSKWSKLFVAQTNANTFVTTLDHHFTATNSSFNSLLPVGRYILDLVHLFWTIFFLLNLC